MKSRLFALAVAGATTALLVAACGEERPGLPCEDSTECPEVECEPGRHVQVCVDKRCLTDVDEACSFAAGTGGSGGGL